MGSYAECWVGNLYVTSSKSDVAPDIMSLFRATDRNVRRDNDPSLPKHLAKKWAADGEADVVYYEASIDAVRSRLELAGYTITNARRLFDEWRQLEVRQQESWELDYPDSASELSRLRALTVDQWIAHLRRINDENLTRQHEDKYKGTLLGDMLESYGGERWYGYTGPDPMVAIRIAIEACPQAETFVYDLTDLIPEYIRKNEDPIQRIIDISASEYHAIGRTIILTEGKSDAWILKEAMGLLYPHLAGYFSFMEFAEFRVGGGAGQLANLVRAFAGAGIVNRVIAVFDNDAAGLAALSSLGRASLPKHIVPMCLPFSPALQAYPTLGPSGPSTMNINGMAASIELYLGSDVLRDACGNLPPIQWTGYESSLQTYQGELLAKSDALERFKDKMTRARADEEYCLAADWSDLRQIFEVIFRTFHELDGEMLSNQLREYYEDQSEQGD